MEKRQHFIYALIIAVLGMHYFSNNDFLRSYVYSLFQKTMPPVISTDRIVYVSDDFTLSQYNSLFTKFSPLENSVVLFLPQIFNIRVGDYLENIDPEAIKSMQEEYKVFTIKFAEMRNIIPVPFLYKGKEKPAEINLKHFGYFKPSEIKLDVGRYNYIKIKSKKMYQTARNMGFYNDLEYYPYRIPVLYRYGDVILVNAAVEAIRRYYRLGKKAVKLDKNILSIGPTYSFPLLPQGDIIIHRIKEKPKMLSYSRAMAAPEKYLNDKIIIVRSNNISMNTMLSLGAVISSIMKGSYVKYHRNINYVIGALFLLGLLWLYKNLRILYGAGVFIMFQAALVFTAYFLLRNNIYTDTVFFTAVNLAAFITVYYYAIAGAYAERRKREAVLGKYMYPGVIKGMVAKNRDIRVKNIWLKTHTAYVSFTPEFSENPENVKKTFEKIRQIIYNDIKEFVIKIQGNHDIVIVFLAEDAPVKDLLKPLFAVREKMTGGKFNIVFNSAEVFIYEFNGEIMVTDRKYETRLHAESIERKKYILVPERDIQEYINVLKFQKAGEVAGNVMFNIVGIREEA